MEALREWDLLVEVTVLRCRNWLWTCWLNT